MPRPVLPLSLRTLERFGRIDGLVNTAGGFAMAGIDQADADHWEGLFGST